MTVLVAGGGIAGLALGLTCLEIGVPVRVFEAAGEVKPLGVGINVQPVAARELDAMGLMDRLDELAVRTRDYGMYTRTGLHLWTEPRGREAGYRWPQFSVHRGALQSILHEAYLERGGTIETGRRLHAYRNTADGVLAQFEGTQEEGAVLVGADGIHSAVRRQMVPDEGEAPWGGVNLYRGTVRAKPFLTGASMVLIGSKGARFVSYPITRQDADGLATLNWIASIKAPAGATHRREDYTRRASATDVLPHMEGIAVDWIDIRDLVERTERIFEYPMVDRDPLDAWTDGRVTLMGDAAHAAYPTGSNGAGSAILDARVLGRALRDHGATADALAAYEAEQRPIGTAMTLMNRATGPDAIIDEVERRMEGRSVDRLEEVISRQEIAAHAARYKQAAGTDVERVNTTRVL